MVPSEVSGVLFTGNPRNAATDEMVVNASWGLGEAIVSGLTQPDEYTIRWSDLGIREQTLGSKQIQVVRDPQTGSGTVHAEVPVQNQARFSLGAEQCRELGQLGRRVTEFYDGMPQDIEFGFADGQLYLLQSRPITGVAFSWDADLEQEAWQCFPEAEGSVWTRALADEAWTGACTPLFYSIRGRLWAKGEEVGMRQWGMPAGLGFQYWKYYKGTPYYNTKIWEVILENAYPQQLRPMLVQNLDPRRQEAVIKAPFRPMTLAKMIGRVYALDREGQGPRTCFKRWDDYLYGELGARANGRTTEELRALSDTELIRYAEDCVEFEADYPASLWTPVQIYVPMALTGLAWMVQNWYTGPNQGLAVDLVTGTRERTATAIENLELWELTALIRQSPTLRAAFNRSAPDQLVTEFSASDEGRAWLERYTIFLNANYHRGHSDRDIYYPRRSEDPSLDYNAIKAFLSADASYDPEAAEEAANTRRNAAYAEAVDNIRRGPLGALKAEAFKQVFEFVTQFLVVRDNERHWLDRSTFTIKRNYQEIGRRLSERGQIENDRDFYFLGREELYDLLHGRANVTLTRAKISARAKNFDAVNDRSVATATHLEGYTPVDLTEAQDDTTGVLRGTGTSGGRVTGTARVVKALADIGSVGPGEILVCNATDPGWTPVFLVIKGIVVETGGVLAHAACLAREYGFPAVQLPSAMQRIPDGATITIDGNGGLVTIEGVTDQVDAA
jgi:pyruvate,water dikinase